jgi:ketosteroid isomerase-like protein
MAFNKALNRHDVAGMMALMREDCVLESPDPPPDGTMYEGKEAVAQFWEGFFRDSPQAHIKIEEIFGLGIRCIARWRYDWTDTAGETQHLRGVDIFQVTNDAIYKQWIYVKGPWGHEVPA